MLTCWWTRSCAVAEVFAPAVKADAATQLTAALLDGTLRIPVARRLPLAQIAEAHELVEHGSAGRVLLEI